MFTFMSMFMFTRRVHPPNIQPNAVTSGGGRGDKTRYTKRAATSGQNEGQEGKEGMLIP